MLRVSLLVYLGLVPCLLTAQEATPSVDAKRMAQQGINYLLERAQSEDGSFSPQTGNAVTGIVVTAILRNEPQLLSHPKILKALTYLESNVRENGGINVDDSRHKNYETCISLMAFSAANRDGKYDKIIARGEAFIREQQWDDGEKIDLSDVRWGGAGYGGAQQTRPDLSNTAFFIDALHELGRDGSDEAMQKALIFVSRTQNLESSYNTTEFADDVNDGGFYYTPDAGGQSPAGKTETGGLRSYGSMTYAGLKSFIYAGLKEDDPRVKAAVSFLQAHYSLSENPGMGASGLYYYYQALAKTMHARGKPSFTDAAGKEHDWRKELLAELTRRQKPTGEWVNGDSDRWMESDPNLVTAYALLAISDCRDTPK